MSNLIFLSQEKLWPLIKKLARECRLPKKIAVPYIGKGGAASLHFRKGDTLICALTEANARNGVKSKSETYLTNFVSQNTTVDWLDLYQVMRAAGQVETILGLTAHTKL
ncbi:MAG: hypothetical protein JNM09_10965 [Blastocatellia bacterium]|nr:hypothetical protein [Blastocatellia bacterium]